MMPDAHAGMHSASGMLSMSVFFLTQLITSQLDYSNPNLIVWDVMLVNKQHSDGSG